MRRRRQVVEVGAYGEIPLELLAGPCIEVWCPGDGTHWVTQRRYRDARAAWLAARGVHAQDLQRIPEPIRGGSTPWSYDYCMTHHGPEYVVDLLERRGLPTTWQPTHVEAYDYGPPLVPTAWQDYKTWRDSAGTEEKT